jgi:DNA-binding transcriptional LysR family regulator
MELRHLKYFIAVAEELHFAKAANRLHLAQPSLSKQIRLLEEELAFPLFYRTKQKVELLDAGHVFVDEARRILRRTENAVESARRTHAGQSGRLLIGHSSSATLEVLPKILRKFCRVISKRDGGTFGDVNDQGRGIAARQSIERWTASVTFVL